VVATSPVLGRTLTRAVGAGELLPRAALTDQGCGDEVSIPVAPRHLPVSIRHGSRVDVFATARTAGSTGTAPGGATDRVLAGVAVQSITRPSAGYVSTVGEWAVVVRVTEALVPDVVRAIRTADIDVVLVLPGGRGPAVGCGPPADGAPADGAPVDPAGPSPPAPSGPLLPSASGPP
jgi:hypothetical protein